MNLNDWRWAVLCGAVCALSWTGASAQTAADTGALEEIVVTAQKREENLQATPISITAVDSESLAEAGVRQIQQLSNIVPAVQVQEITGAPAMAIRGIGGVGQGTSIEQPVAVYVNGAYLPRPQSYNGHFFDIERMEVLLGPQGTLYGRNAVSGVMNFITRKPGDNFAANAQLELGNYDLRRIEGGVTLPVGEVFSSRFAVLSNQRDGYFKNGLGDVGELAARATFRFTPSDNQTFTLIGDWEKMDNRNQDGRGGASSDATVYSSPNPNVVIPPDFDNNFIFGAGAGSFLHSDQYGATLQYDYAFAPATFTVIGGYRQFDSDSLGYSAFTLLNNGSISSVTLSDSIVNFDLKTVEVRLTSAATEPLKWVIGGYWLDQSNDGGVYSYQAANPAAANAAYQARRSSLGFLNPVDEGKAYAAFGDATWTPTGMERLHLTAGIRWSRDEKEGVTVFSFPSSNVTAVGGGERQWDAVTWRFSPSFDLTESSMIYASASRGYEAGGFAFAPPGFDSSYKPQYVVAYELGSKNQFFDNRLRLNADVYYYDYTDKQYIYSYQGQGGLRIGITNYDAQYWGSSLAAEALLTKADVLSFDAAYAYGKSGGLSLSQFSTSLTDVPRGARLRAVTPFTANVSYRHTFDLGATTLVPQLMYHFTRYATQREATGGVSALTRDAYIFYDTPDVKRWDLLLSWAGAGRRWDVTAYVRNLTDEYNASRPLVYTAATNGRAEIFGISPLPPRTYGVIASVNF